jgi:hypothetical protein
MTKVILQKMKNNIGPPLSSFFKTSLLKIKNNSGFPQSPTATPMTLKNL